MCRTTWPPTMTICSILWCMTRQARLNIYQLSSQHDNMISTHVEYYSFSKAVPTWKKTVCPWKIMTPQCSTLLLNNAILFVYTLRLVIVWALLWACSIHLIPQPPKKIQQKCHKILWMPLSKGFGSSKWSIHTFQSKPKSMAKPVSFEWRPESYGEALM